MQTPFLGGKELGGPAVEDQAPPTVFFVAGTPAQQGSKSVNRKTGGMFENASGRLRPWRQEVTAAAQRALEARRAPFTEAVSCELEFAFRRPGAHWRAGERAQELLPRAPRFHTQSPDIDKLARAVLDAITWGGLWIDDRQVSRLVVTRVWLARRNGTPGVTVAVRVLS